MFKKKIQTLLAVSLLAMASLSSAVAPKLVVGGKNFTEQRLLAEMTGQYLKANGFDVDLRTDMGSALVRAAQEHGQIDLYWEYTGTSLISYNKITETLSPEETYRRVKELDAKKGIVWLNPSTANNTWALAIRESDRDRLPFRTVSELKAALEAGKTHTLAAGVQFASRPDGLPGLEKMYGFKYPRPLIKQMDPGLTYQAIRDGQVDIAAVYTTDGRVQAFKLLVLKDDKNFFPPYALVPVVRQDTLEKYPQLAPLMNAMSAKLDDTSMRKLNAAVDVDKKTFEKVARDFLVENKLIKDGK
ncbi:glycine betaine ABC transporter substrate-binding protein [Glaciimonas sp. PCH181]|uniref:glycine betaine ABC transporter substrate-binding protein n=1 Tax=Glaciimonas sp. PCH181 TaxID=2133943 RepID=UPI000D3DA5F7|nr:glycine betaine ABC transporter substrate-binding protein [Glaciimonas sp. PCH181]PUA18057.1 glycine/betaine ABC transporter substrate-binding protein [Glaciimonas sp. PCH181]